MSTPFDSSYKRIFSMREVIRHFAEGYLPGGWETAVRWDTLELVPTRRVGPTLEQRENDLICRVTRRDGSGLYICLMLEFQSGTDLSMAVRINTYLAYFIEDDWRRRDPERTWRVPALVPAVIYTGRAEWNAPLELVAQFPEELHDLSQYGQRLRYALVEAQRAPKVPGERPNVADALFRMERAKGRKEALRAAAWMNESLARVGNPEVDAALVDWARNVHIPTRAPGAEVKRVANWKEIPEVMEKYFDSWADALIAKGRRELLLNQVRQLYGERTAAAAAPLLETVESSPKLDEIGGWIVDGGSGETLLARIRAL